MTTEYKPGMVIGETIEIFNYTSTSEKQSVAAGFSNQSTDCCLYELEIEKGIPYINMISSTQYASEFEILLPRNILITYVGLADYTISGKPVKRMNVKMKYPEQFNLFTGCNKFSIVDIKPIQYIKIEKKHCEKGYVLDKNNMCTNIKQISREINTIIDEIKSSSNKFVKFNNIENICNIVYNSYDIIAKYEDKNYVSFFFDNIKDYMDKYHKLGWKNYNYHYSRIFENYNTIDIQRFINAAKEYKKSVNREEQLKIMKESIGGLNNEYLDPYGNLKDFVNYIKFRYKTIIDDDFEHDTKIGTIIDVRDYNPDYDYDEWKEAKLMDRLSNGKYKVKFLENGKEKEVNLFLKRNSYVIPWRFFKVNDKLELKYNGKWVIAKVKTVNYKKKIMLLTFVYESNNIEYPVGFDDEFIQPIDTHIKKIDIDSLKQTFSAPYIIKRESYIHVSSKKSPKSGKQSSVGASVGSMPSLVADTPKQSSTVGVISPKKLKKCSKGFIRNKNTGICEPKNIVKSTKLKKCSKGFIRNKKTGICEPKK